MPVTIKPSPEAVGRNRDPTVKSAQQLYSRLVAAWEKEVHHGQPNTKRTKPVLHSSFENLSSNGEAMIIPYGNSFVEGVMRPFQQDLHLVVRPDDVWLSILTQFSFYVSAHSEELRHKFVNHQGNETLVVADNARPFHSLDVGHMAQMIMPLTKEKMADKTVHDWLIPGFSTSTELDLAVSSMVMMATMKDYFRYEMWGGCGFPSVTLLGEAADWNKILISLDKFAEYGQEPAAWSKLLKPVIKRFVATFYLPDSMELKEFWMQALHAEGKFGSGPFTHLQRLAHGTYVLE
jgi:hypothetical protein